MGPYSLFFSDCYGVFLIIRYLHGKGAQLEVSVQKALSLACSSKGRLRVFARTKPLQSGLLVKRGMQSGLMIKKG